MDNCRKNWQKDHLYYLSRSLGSYISSILITWFREETGIVAGLFLNAIFYDAENASGGSYPVEYLPDEELCIEAIKSRYELLETQ